MSKERKDLGTTLALEAIMKRNSSAPFTVYVTMDIKKPETIENFAAFGEMLADAYDKGAAAEVRAMLGRLPAEQRVDMVQGSEPDHESHCNLRWPATLNTPEDHCSCKLSKEEK